MEILHFFIRGYVFVFLNITQVATIWIENPSRVRMAQWVDQSGEDGLIDLEMEMTFDPPLGEWKIKVDTGKLTKTQIFKVEEYGRCDFQTFKAKKKKEVMLPSSGKFEILGRSVDFCFVF